MPQDDLKFSYQEAKEIIQANKTYKEVSDEIKERKRRAGDSLEQASSKTSTTEESLVQKKKRYQRQVKSQLEELLELQFLSSGSGNDNSNYIKRKFTQTLLEIKPKLKSIVEKETISALGCSQEQKYVAGDIYIKVSAIDPSKRLKVSPDEPGSIGIYESSDTGVGVTPYSMNRQLYTRLQNLNVPFSTSYNTDYIGKSGQALFDIEYVTQDNFGNTGEFYKVSVRDRQNGENLVTEFLTDYYKTIEVLDLRNFAAQLANVLTGLLDMELVVGTQQIGVEGKFFKILTRILGLCFDNRVEIDVAGTSKISELDGIDDTFFEMTDQDLREIDNFISNVKQGVVEFVDCDNIKLPLDRQNVLNQLQLLDVQVDGNQNDYDSEVVDGLVDSIVSQWEIEFPKLELRHNLTKDFLKNYPLAITLGILGPKMLLPLLIMGKSLQKNAIDDINDLNDFIRQYKKMIINLTSKIAALFIETLFNIIKKDLLNLVSSILIDVINESKKARYSMIYRLLVLAQQVGLLIDDYRKCKNVIDNILLILAATKNVAAGKKQLPYPALLLAPTLPGFSTTRASINVIQELQKAGINTGPNPDGTVNKGVLAEIQRITGVQKESDENGKVEFALPPSPITPAMTLPPIKLVGKTM